jgi:hypothetical protein
MTDDFPHGELRGYSSGCDCDACRAANAAYHRTRRAWLKQHAPAKQVPHGTNGGYHNYGCHCADCRQAAAAYNREYNARRR